MLDVLSPNHDLRDSWLTIVLAHVHRGLLVFQVHWVALESYRLLRCPWCSRVIRIGFRQASEDHLMAFVRFMVTPHAIEAAL